MMKFLLPSSFFLLINLFSLTTLMGQDQSQAISNEFILGELSQQLASCENLTPIIERVDCGEGELVLAIGYGRNLHNQYGIATYGGFSPFSGNLVNIDVSFNTPSQVEILDGNPQAPNQKSFGLQGILDGQTIIQVTITATYSDQFNACTHTATFDLTGFDPGVYINPDPAAAVGRCGTDVGINYSEVKTFFDQTAPADYPVFLHANLFVNQDVNFVGRDWFTSAGHEIRTTKEVQFTDCLLSSADCEDNLWNGLVAWNDAEYKLSNVTLEHAIRGVYLSPGTDGLLEGVGSRFLNNIVAIRGVESSANIMLSQNEFSAPSIPVINDEKSDCTEYECTRGETGISLFECAPLVINGPNSFSQFQTGIRLYNTNAELVSQNFRDILEPCLGRGRAVYATYTPNLGAASNLILTANNITQTDIGIDIEDRLSLGDIELSANVIDEVNIGIQYLGEGLNSLLNLKMNDNTIYPSAANSTGGNGNPTGIFARFRDSYPGIVEVSENQIELNLDNSVGINMLGELGAFFPVFLDVSVSDNFINWVAGQSSRGIRVQSCLSINVWDNIVVQSNDAGGIGIQIVDSREVLACGNRTFMSSDAWQGISVRNSTQGSVVGSTTRDAGFGIQMAGDCEPYNIADNTIRGFPDVGIFHTMPGANFGFQTTDNQEGKLNKWIEDIVEVTTIGTEEYKVYSDLQMSPFSDWSPYAGQNNISCSFTKGEINGFVDYTGGPKEVVDMEPMLENGIYQLKAFNLYARLQNAEDGYAAEFADWLEYQGQRSSGLSHTINSILAGSGPTLEEKQSLQTANANGDKATLLSLGQQISDRKEAAITEAIELLQAFTPNSSLEALWRSARLASLSSVDPTEGELDAWHSIASDCYDETGPAGQLFASLYTFTTGEIVDPQCGNEMQLRFDPHSEEHLSQTNFGAFVSQGVLQVSDLSIGTEVSIVDINGRSLLSKKLDASLSVDVHKLQPGIYVIATKEASPQSATFIISQ